MKKQFLILCAFSVLMACKKPADSQYIDDPVPIDRTNAIKVEHGQPTGSSTKKTIGPEGGELALPGGEVELIIPAGALTVSTEISIQPVGSTLEKIGVGQSYRFLPEGIQFKKDVTVRIAYADSTDLNGKNPNLFSLAYQDKDGYWHFSRNAQVQRNINTVSVKTRHFSDWTILSPISIEVTGKKDLLSNEQTTLVVRAIMPPAENELDDLLRVGLSQKNIKEWSADLGSIVGEKTAFQVNYKAPLDIPKESVATVSVQLKDLNYVSLNASIGDEETLEYALSLVPDQYMHLKIDGGLTYARQVNATINREALILSGNFSPISFSLVRWGDMKVTPFGRTSDLVKSSAELIMGNRTYRSNYIKCDNTEHITIGNVTIDKIDKIIGGVVEGSFTGKVAVANFCQTSETSTIEGKFRMRISDIQY